MGWPRSDPERPFHNFFCRPEKKSRDAIKIAFSGEKIVGCNFCFFVFLRVCRGAQGCAGAQGGAGVRNEGPNEACLRDRGGPMLRGFVDALDR